MIFNKSLEKANLPPSLEQMERLTIVYFRLHIKGSCNPCPFFSPLLYSLAFIFFNPLFSPKLLPCAPFGHADLTISQKFQSALRCVVCFTLFLMVSFYTLTDDYNILINPAYSMSFNYMTSVLCNYVLQIY